MGLGPGRPSCPRRRDWVENECLEVDTSGSQGVSTPMIFSEGRWAPVSQGSDVCLRGRRHVQVCVQRRRRYSPSGKTRGQNEFVVKARRSGRPLKSLVSSVSRTEEGWNCRDSVSGSSFVGARSGQSGGGCGKRLRPNPTQILTRTRTPRKKSDTLEGSVTLKGKTDQKEIE